VDANSELISIPAGIASDGKVVLNLAPAAIQNLEMTNELVSFSARFNGVSEQIFVPISSLLAIYARENGEGMMFPAEGDDPVGSTDDGSARPKSPTLTVVK
jgi:stringent starvation protein B